MIFVPLPFVVTILLALLFLSALARDENRPRNLPFLALIALAALQSALVGLRFGYGVEAVRLLSPILASLMAPMVYFGALHLVGPRPSLTTKTLGRHGIAPMLVLLAVMVLPHALDAVLIGTFVVYAVLLLRLVWSGADALRLATLDGATTAYRALVFAALALLFSAAVDTMIVIDIALGGARHLPQLVSIGNVATLLLLAMAGAAASRERTPAEIVAPTAPAPTPGDPPATAQPDPAMAEESEVLATLEGLMAQAHLYRDSDLNLDRLARRAVIPSRQISGAINRLTGKNVSQYVNDFRIAEACEHLRASPRPVTEIMFEVGFLTKSNFNREFRRVTGQSPSEWRNSNRLGSDDQS